MKKLLGFVLATSMFACAHAPVRLERERNDAYAAVRAAEQAGADRYSRAAWHLKYARDRLRAAEELIEDGEGVRAKRALEEAIVDGQLASRIVEEAQLAQKLDRAEDRARLLRAKAATNADDPLNDSEARASLEIEADDDELEIESGGKELEIEADDDELEVDIDD